MSCRLGQSFFLTIVLAFFSNSLYADTSPIDIDQVHSAQVSGMIKKFRLTIDDSSLHDNNDISSELFVTLDVGPKKEYSVKINNDSEISAEVITETLRYAYINRLPITIFHSLPLHETEQFRILMVQIGDESERKIAKASTQTAINRIKR